LQIFFFEKESLLSLKGYVRIPDQLYQPKRALAHKPRLMHLGLIFFFQQ
jgi:hypothetical protein